VKSRNVDRPIYPSFYFDKDIRVSDSPFPFSLLAEQWQNTNHSEEHSIQQSQSGLPKQSEEHKHKTH
jgi:hypothetical protein